MKTAFVALGILVLVILGYAYRHPKESAEVASVEPHAEKIIPYQEQSAPAASIPTADARKPSAAQEETQDESAASPMDAEREKQLEAMRAAKHQAMHAFETLKEMIEDLPADQRAIEQVLPAAINPKDESAVRSWLNGVYEPASASLATKIPVDLKRQDDFLGTFSGQVQASSGERLSFQMTVQKTSIRPTRGPADGQPHDVFIQITRDDKTDMVKAHTVLYLREYDSRSGMMVDAAGVFLQLFFGDKQKTLLVGNVYVDPETRFVSQNMNNEQRWVLRARKIK